jgi:hypothetical protein
MVDAKQSETRGLSWFRPGGGRTSSSGVLGALYCSAPGVPVVGQLQSKRERRPGLQVPGEVAEDVVRELGNVCVVRRKLSVVRCVLCFLPCPLWQGSSPSFYRPRRGRITSMPHYSATWGGMVRRAVEWAAALTVLAAIWPSWRILYPNSGGFEGRGAVVGRDVPRRARGGC